MKESILQLKQINQPKNDRSRLVKTSGFFTRKPHAVDMAIKNLKKLSTIHRYLFEYAIVILALNSSCWLSQIISDGLHVFFNQLGACGKEPTGESLIMMI